MGLCELRSLCAKVLTLALALVSSNRFVSLSLIPGLWDEDAEMFHPCTPEPVPQLQC